jgi:hypothetical protein
MRNRIWKLISQDDRELNGEGMASL